MKHDFYAEFQIDKQLEKGKENIDNLIKGIQEYSEIKDLYSRIMLLITAYVNDNLKDYARVGKRDVPSGLKAILHSYKSYDVYITHKLSELNLLGINTPIDISSLPKYSWVLEFPITLEKPFISKDDVPLYIIENPIRKDKVFGVPQTPASAWKGNLRWTMMKIFLEPNINNPERFVEIRFRHTLLFGTEKGFEDVPKSWTKYLDGLCPDAKEIYRNKLKEFFNIKNIKNFHSKGMLYFYPTFWNKIDMMVINPHDRETKAGTKPIYFEIVPEDAEGFFRLVYVPIYWIGLGEKDLKKEVLKDLKSVVIGIREMMLTYGFSAKKSIGFGKIRESWDKNMSRLEIKGFTTKKFGNFDELREIIEKLEG